jgi:DNA-binding MarR family transcriptional regulator
MGNLIGDIFYKRDKIGERVVVQITPLGKTKADGFALPGNKWRVLTMLGDAGPSSIKEIADETNLPEAKVKAIVKSLIQSGYVKKSGMDGD